MQSNKKYWEQVDVESSINDAIESEIINVLAYVSWPSVILGCEGLSARHFRGWWGLIVHILSACVVLRMHRSTLLAELLCRPSSKSDLEVIPSTGESGGEVPCWGNGAPEFLDFVASLPTPHVGPRRADHLLALRATPPFGWPSLALGNGMPLGLRMPGTAA